jgi:SAM-dependent methyltransferase
LSTPRIDDAGTLKKQYGTSEKLAARGRLHRNYSTAEVPWFTWVVMNLDLAPSARVLDIGCGPGWFWAATADDLPNDLDLTLADLSPGMVAEAMGRVSGLKSWTVHGAEADVAALPFPNESFDAVFAMHMLYHAPDPAAGIAEIARVLRPGGIAAVTTNGPNNLKELYALTTAFGGKPKEPVADVFGFEAAERLLRAAFGNVAVNKHPGGMRVTEPEDVFLALTSYPPGDSASEVQLAAFRDAIDDAFARGGGALEIETEVGLFVSRKPDR